jgi:hypothetical protein
MMLDDVKGVGAGEGGEENMVRIWCVCDKTRGDVEPYHLIPPGGKGELSPQTLRACRPSPWLWP